ncbi:MAG: dihydroneopterin aldolase [Clostridia bacterium]|nr:dihydroneopterin aldolase [Clostridia bacterium]
MVQDKIILKGMEFYGYHGVLPEEKRLGQRFVIDLELYRDLQEAGLTDDLRYTINYAEVYQLVEKLVAGENYDLVEALAEGIGARILENFPVEGVLVRVQKPQAPIPGKFSWVGVEIYRGADNE